jgi:hypothetical protein
MPRQCGGALREGIFLASPNPRVRQNLAKGQKILFPHHYIISVNALVSAQSFRRRGAAGVTCTK